MADKVLRPSHLRAEYMFYIDQHQYIPDHMKQGIKDIVGKHFQIMSETIGNVELAYRRGIQAGEEQTNT